MIATTSKENFLYDFDKEAIKLLYQLCGNKEQAARIYNDIVIEAREEALLCVTESEYNIDKYGYVMMHDDIQVVIGNALEIKLGK